MAPICPCGFGWLSDHVCFPGSILGGIHLPPVRLEFDKWMCHAFTLDLRGTTVELILGGDMTAAVLGPRDSDANSNSCIFRRYFSQPKTLHIETSFCALFSGMRASPGLDATMAFKSNVLVSLHLCRRPAECKCGRKQVLLDSGCGPIVVRLPRLLSSKSISDLILRSVGHPAHLPDSILCDEITAGKINEEKKRYESTRCRWTVQCVESQAAGLGLWG
ncbi:hypothetical protein CEXT_400351 [Caerostris extrusa]|uniref:Uncharacterized protein n=1 Tax=Caerostris extrusa TaxID=172846 RepID=A0AAV4Q720_CAEEX|nr:hypothetical protein CEXT_400351 [Caerostris extrusa]